MSEPRTQEEKDAEAERLRNAGIAEEIAQEDALFPWLASDCMADETYEEYGE